MMNGNASDKRPKLKQKVLYDHTQDNTSHPPLSLHNLSMLLFSVVEKIFFLEIY